MHARAGWPLLKKTLAPLAALIATAWARHHEARILARGEPLSALEQQIARAVGVLEPHRIRVMRVPQVPLPAGRILMPLARLLDVPTEIDGMTLGRGIYLCGGSPRLLAHECRHVQQVESAGSIA